MAALTEARTTPSREGKSFARSVAGGVKIHEGALVCLDANGNATPGAEATTLTADGVARSTVDNTDGAAGDMTAEIERGCFRFANSSSTDEITAADIGSTAYVVDDQTVAKTDGDASRSAAGEIVDVDAQGVWVQIG